MSDVRARYRRLFDRGEGTERIEFFSDAVFAIAMTLLVLEIRLPEGTEEGGVAAALGSIWFEIFAYALGFTIIALNWMAHHRKFRVIERYDGGLVRINLLFLLVIAFVPFPTALLSEFGATTPTVVLYAGTVAAIGLLQLWLWIHASRAGLMSQAVDPAMSRYVALNQASMPIVFGLSIVIALFAPLVAMFSWFLQYPLGLLVERLGRRRADVSASSSAESSASSG